MRAALGLIVVVGVGCKGRESKSESTSDIRRDGAVVVEPPPIDAPPPDPTTFGDFDVVKRLGTAGGLEVFTVKLPRFDDLLLAFVPPHGASPAVRCAFHEAAIRQQRTPNTVISILRFDV